LSRRAAAPALPGDSLPDPHPRGTRRTRAANKVQLPIALGMMPTAALLTPRRSEGLRQAGVAQSLVWRWDHETVQIGSTPRRRSRAGYGGPRARGGRAVRGSEDQAHWSELGQTGRNDQVEAVISNPERADGSDRIILLKNVNGHLKRQASAAPTWTNGGRKGVAYFWVVPTPSAMGIAKYRAAWTHPEGTTRSNVLRVEID